LYIVLFARQHVISALFFGAQVPGDNLVRTIIHAIVYTSFTIRACLAELLDQLSGRIQKKLSQTVF